MSDTKTVKANLIIQADKDLTDLTTYKVAVKAKYFVEITSKEELLQINWQKYPKILVIGEGSNILFLQDYPGLIIKNKIESINTLQENQKEVLIQVGAGINWHQFVEFCLNKDYGGLENLSLIPGTVGACPVQNIGAYGVEVKDLIKSIEFFEIATNSFKKITNAEAQFGYRNSIFKTKLKNKAIITSVNFGLSKKNHKKNIQYRPLKEYFLKRQIQNPTIKQISQAVIAIRQSKLPDPAVEPNCGSFFKNQFLSISKLSELKQDYPNIPYYKTENPEIVKIPTAWLIDTAGLKGYRKNGIGTHPKQALAIINYENKNGKEVFEFAQFIILKVKQKFGLEIKPEVNII